MRRLPRGGCVEVAAFHGHDRLTAGMCGNVQTGILLVLKKTNRIISCYISSEKQWN